MTEEVSKVEEKRCPRCTKDLPIGEFGVNRQKASGRNVYCKRCNRFKTNTSREAKREREGRVKGARKRRVAPVIPKTRVEKPITPVLRDIEMVKAALCGGPLTQTQIASQTTLTIDKIGEALAELMLERGEVVRRKDGDQNVYSLARKVKAA